ncbi:helix-turn-helix domain-containing protein [Thermococcus paralvinellae]|uniref:LexA-related DNA-binding protein n=1 Tax=Thermococcus paralvinellae TaxID=582419 RepID=W0I158_9EURY|nr:DNA-binding protein [Thermococcus paralvinellae]AHF79781.1 LexA-related DNA-binding protein [Thermococcus paralvinellae]
MVNLEEVLELVKKGYTNPKEIAKTLNLAVEEVEGMMRILESLGYIERVKLGSSLCRSCPLRKLCSGECIHFRGQIYLIFKKEVSK